jgi:glycerol-3-phosphate dehydrogenase
MEVTSIEKSGERIDGVIAKDREAGREYRLQAKAVINATGVYSDSVRRLDDPEVDSVISPSQGTHLMLDRAFLNSDSAIMVPHTDDGRVLFAVPWCGRVLIGTTDTPVTEILPEPRPLAEEIDFLLTHAARYLVRQPRRSDILSVFAGLRPLAREKGLEDTSSLSRDHVVKISRSGLITVTGGKWTTYRKMAEDAVDRAESVAGLGSRPSVTDQLPVHGWQETIENGPWSVYGSDMSRLAELAAREPSGKVQLHPRLPYRVCQVIWGVRHEYARTVEDILARRTRVLILDARASMEMAPRVARLMAAELGYDENWQELQVRDFLSLAQGYLPEMQAEG